VFESLNRAGRTVVLITHEPDIAERTKRTVRLRDGQVVSDEPTRIGSRRAELTAGR